MLNLEGIVRGFGGRGVSGAKGFYPTYAFFELPHEGDRIEIDLTISPQMLSETDA